MLLLVSKWSDDAQLCDDSCEKQSTYQFLGDLQPFWAFVMQMTNERIQCTGGRGGGRDQASEWQLKRKHHCTFLQVIKTQVQLNSTHKNLLQRHKNMNLIFEISLLGSVPTNSTLLWVASAKKLYYFQKCWEFPIFIFLSRNTHLCTKVENILEYLRFIYLFIWHLDVELSLLLW
jgi:hypothetical protein